MSSFEPTPSGSPSTRGQSARVELSSSMPSIELSVVGSDFRLLAAGIGRLSAEVPPGIYQVVARAGPVVDRKLIQLAVGAVYRDDDVSVRFPAPAPVTDTTTTHEYQQYAVQQASAAVGSQPGPPAALVVVVRDTRGYDGPPLDEADLAPFDLLDGSLNPLDGFTSGWQVQHREAIATWSGRLPPGGYALRTDPSRSPGGPRAPAGSQAYDQSIWLSDNWQTIVFVTTGPGGPRTAAASIHMAGISGGWNPYDSRVGQALELASWGLREGRSVVADDLLNLLLNTKFVNPMLGIVGAHSLLLSDKRDHELIGIVVRNLEAMVPGHPDVIALRWMAGDAVTPAGGEGSGLASGVPGATWPPMLLPSYRTLVAKDASEPGAIVDGSPAERVASRLLVQGIWTTWAPLGEFQRESAAPTDVPDARGNERPLGAPEGGRPARPLPAPGVAPPAAMSAGSPPERSRRSIAPPAAVTAGLLPLLDRDPSLIERVTADDPAVARVAGYLVALAALEGAGGRGSRFATLTPQEIGLATTLPVATVDRALGRIAAFVAPPGGGGSVDRRAPGGDGGSGGSGLVRWALPLLAAGVLVLAGVAGVVALCSGREFCLPGPVAVEVTEPPADDDEGDTLPPASLPPDERDTGRPPDRVTAAITSPPTQPPPTPAQLQHLPELDFADVFVFDTAHEPFTVLTPEPIGIFFEVTDDPDGAFATENACVSASVDDQLGCTVIVEFTPRREGVHLATLAMRVDNEPEPRLVPLVGEGVPLVLSHAPTLDFESVTVGSPRERRLAVIAQQPVHLEFRVANDPLLAFETEPLCDWVARDTDFACTADVTFKPELTGDYTATLEIVTFEPDPRTVQLTGSASDVVG